MKQARNTEDGKSTTKCWYK